MAWAEAHLRTKWHLDPFSRLATTDMGRKLGACPLFSGGGELGPHVAQCGMGRSLPPCQNAKCRLDPSSCLVTIDMGRKWVGTLPTFGGGETGSPSNAMSLGPRPTSLPSGILIHPAVWSQQTWAENGGGSAPFSGGVNWVPI